MNDIVHTLLASQREHPWKLLIGVDAVYKALQVEMETVTTHLEDKLFSL